MYGGCILQFGTKYHHETFLSSVDDVSKGLGCFALSELGHGSNMQALETLAELKGENFIIHTPTDTAQKYWVGNSSTARMAVVFAQTIVMGQSVGVHPFIVPLRDENGNLFNGIDIKDCGKKLGLQGLDTGRIRFTNVIIPKENLLNRYIKITKNGKFKSQFESNSMILEIYLSVSLGFSRLITSIGIMSITRNALSIAISYAFKRRQFGTSDSSSEKKLISYKLHQLRLIPHLVDSFAIKAFSDYVKKYYIKYRSQNDKKINFLIVALRVSVSEHSKNTIESCIGCCGGQGILSRNFMINCRSDIDAFRAQDVDSQVLLQHVAGHAVSQFVNKYRKGLGHLYYSGKWMKSFIEETPIARRMIRLGHLMDREFHYTCFKYREFHLTRSLAIRLHARVVKGDSKSLFNAWNELGDHVNHLGKAYIERRIHESFVKTIDALPEDSSIRPLLEDLCAFYALWHIKQDNEWFLERNFFLPVKTKAIRELVNQLCQKISNQSLDLIKSWDIDESFFENTIASDDFIKTQSFL